MARKMSEFLEKECKIDTLEFFDGDLFFLGLYDVMCGVRVRGGRSASFWCDIDICCGDSVELVHMVKDLYSWKMKKNLKEKKDIFDGLIKITILKPVSGDKDFMDFLDELQAEKDR